MTLPPHITIARASQLSASPAEPLALQITAELATGGLLRAQVHAWNDRVTFARAHGDQVVALIAWRTQEWTREAFVSLGGVHPAYRRQGVYRALFADVVQDVRDNHPDVDRIASGHHVDNAASAAMHKALGRRLEGFVYAYPIERSGPHLAKLSRREAIARIAPDVFGRVSERAASLARIGADQDASDLRAILSTLSAPGEGEG